LDDEYATLPPPIDLADPYFWGTLLVRLVFIYLVARWVSWAAMSVALRGWRRAQDKHWVERARLAWPGRRVGVLSFFILMPLLLTYGGFLGKPPGLMPALVVTALVLLVCYVGTLQTRIAWENRISPAVPLTPRAGRGAWVLRTSVFSVLIATTMLLVALISKTGDRTAWAIIVGGIMTIAAYLSWGWARVLRSLGVLRPASARLQAIVERLVRQSNARPVRVEEAALPMANALAFPIDRRIAVTDSALAILSDDELAAVCAHELAHLSEPTWVRAIRMSATLVVGTMIAMPAALLVLSRGAAGQHDGGRAPLRFLLITFAYLAFCVIFLIFHRRLYRRMEVRADAMGKELEPAPGVYATALEKLYATNLVPVVIGSRRQRYPELYDRLMSAGAQPDYPRPAAPPRVLRVQGFVVLVLGAIAGCLTLQWLARLLEL
jgi:Zn-dependent protease with chaperone function